jgi:NTE family protein
MFLAGKMLNALMLDPIERDLWNAEYRNRIVRWGSTRYGAAFADEAEAAVGLRHVDIVHITPSEDLGRMAGEIYRSEPPPATKVVRFLLDKIADYTFDREADFLSYLLFDRAYTGALEALGFEDARRREADLATLSALTT